ncbi:MAG: glycosyltransferase family 2 protein [Actinomycetota bacterium]
MNIKSLIVIVTYNSQNFIESCLRSVVGQDYKDWFLIVIDNASADNTVTKIRQFRNISTEITNSNFKFIALKKNIGFSRAVNQAVFSYIKKIKNADEQPEFLILLNPDVYLKRNALKKIISTFKLTERESASSNKIGVAGGLILDYKKDIVQHSGGKIKDNFITFHMDSGKSYSNLRIELKLKKDAGIIVSQINNVKDADYVTGAFFATEFGLFKSIGGFDKGYRPVYFEELDYCLKIRRTGRRIVVNSDSIARHFEGASIEKFSKRFYRYYHKNRIRCAVINTGFLDFFGNFSREEMRWLRSEVTRDQILPVFYAYFINFVFLPYNLTIKLKNHLILNRLELK